MKRRPLRCASSLALLAGAALFGCADRSPPAAWPEPRPPGLSSPLPDPTTKPADAKNEDELVSPPDDPSGDIRETPDTPTGTDAAGPDATSDD